MSHSHLLRIGRMSGKGIILAAAKHNLREIQAERGAGSNIDALQSKLNYVLYGPDNAAGVAGMAQSLMDGANVKPLRKDAVRGLEIIFSLPPQTTIEHKNFFIDCVAWSERYFKVPLLSATVHLDEAAPHCHVLLLPLIDGCMKGSSIFGHRAKLMALQADFHAQVGQVYGMVRQATQKRYSAALRHEAADMILTAINESPSRLKDRDFVDALRVALSANPEPMILALGLRMPRKQSKHKTFAAIMTQKCKPDKAIGFDKLIPIGFGANERIAKEQSLSCVGFQNPPLTISPATPTSLNDVDCEYERKNESKQAANYWLERLRDEIKV